MYVSFRLWDACCRQNETLDAALRAMPFCCPWIRRERGTEAKSSYSKHKASALPWLSCFPFDGTRYYEEQLDRCLYRRPGLLSIPVGFIELALRCQRELETSMSLLWKIIYTQLRTLKRAPPKYKQGLMDTSVSSEAQLGMSLLLRSLWGVGAVQFLLWQDWSSWLAFGQSSLLVLGGHSVFFVL